MKDIREKKENIKEENRNIWEIIFTFFLLSLAISLIMVGSFNLFNDYKDYRNYNEFCVERPTFCYCSWYKCSFKTRWSSVDGFTQDTQDLCELATKLNDKQILFEVGCEEHLYTEWEGLYVLESFNLTGTNPNSKANYQLDMLDTNNAIIYNKNGSTSIREFAEDMSGGRE